MNKQLASLIVTLLIFPFAAVSAPADSDKVTEPQAAPTGLQPGTTASDENKTPEKTEIAKTPVADKAVEPITGAFGIQLGEQFDASMVAKVLSKQEHSYKGQGGIKLKGQLLRIEPGKPDERFQQYSIKTSDAGIIYAIQGDYQYKVESDEARSNEAKANETKPEGKGKGAGKPGNKKPANAIQKTCKAAVKTMAGELESRYGKPRGQGWDGLWYTFRQPSDTSNRGLKLYGHRCRTGMYSIIYTDDKVQRGMSSGKVDKPPEAGKPTISSAPTKP